jgi:hypothetical protein
MMTRNSSGGAGAARTCTQSRTSCVTKFCTVLLGVSVRRIALFIGPFFLLSPDSSSSIRRPASPPALLIIPRRS